MNMCSITPNRGGERENLLMFCCEQLKWMGMANTYIMNEPAKSGKCDLVWRVRAGLELAKKDGMDWVFIIESDDAYPTDYISRFAPHMHKYDFIGDQTSLYYRLDTRQYQGITHPGRASLYTTAFRVSALDNFKWPPDDKVFLDIDLWKHTRQKRLKCKFIDSGAVGIKGHGIGMSGGKGHRMKLSKDDKDLKFLRSKVEDHHMEFYHNLMGWK